MDQPNQPSEPEIRRAPEAQPLRQPHVWLPVVVAALVGFASMCVVAYVGYNARIVAEKSLTVAEENLKWLHEAHQRTIAENRAIKKRDNATRFFNQFFEIEKNRNSKDLRDFYFEQLYGLLFDEYVTYRDGFLDKGLYTTWMDYRWKRYHDQGSDEAQQWKRLRGNFILDKDFIAFMDALFAFKKMDDVKGLVDKLEVHG
jgi:hypothetical protein